MEKNWVIIDLDGTLCDCSHRVHWAQAKQWDQFHSGIKEDKVNGAIAWLMKRASEAGNSIMICTGRNEAHRLATMEWLKANDLSSCIDTMLMRPDDSRLSDHELKVSMVDEFFGGREAALESVLVVLDDRDKVVQAWRDAGHKCWQVEVGSY